MNEQMNELIRHPLLLITNPLNKWHKVLLSWYLPACLFLLDSNQMLNINWISFLIGTVKFHRTTAVIQPDLCVAATCCSLCSAGFASSSRDHLHSWGLGIKLGCQGMLSSSHSALPWLSSPWPFLQTLVSWKVPDTGPGCVTCSTEGRTGCISRPHSHRIKGALCFNHWLKAAAGDTCFQNFTGQGGCRGVQRQL